MDQHGYSESVLVVAKTVGDRSGAVNDDSDSALRLSDTQTARDSQSAAQADAARPVQVDLPVVGHLQCGSYGLLDGSLGYSEHGMPARSLQPDYVIGHAHRQRLQLIEWLLSADVEFSYRRGLPGGEQPDRQAASDAGLWPEYI